MNFDLIHKDVSMLKIDLCPCCNGTYFTFTVDGIDLPLFFYYPQKSLEKYLYEKQTEVYLDFSTFDSTDCKYIFDIKRFFEDETTDDMMIHLFNNLYESNFK